MEYLELLGSIRRKLVFVITGKKTALIINRHLKFFARMVGFPVGQRSGGQLATFSDIIVFSTNAKYDPEK